MGKPREGIGLVRLLRSTDLVKQLLVPFSGAVERSEVSFDDVLSQLFFHLDDDWPGHTWTSHHVVIALDSGVNAPEQKADLP